MGYLDALVANTFRIDSKGRRVFVFRCGRAFVVPEDRAAAFQRFQRRYFAMMFVALPVSAIIFRSVLAVFMAAIVWLAGWFLKVSHFTRGLEVATEVPEISREHRIAQATAAMGARTIAAVGLTAAGLALGGGWLLATRTQNVVVVLLTAYFSLVAVLYAVRWRQQRQRDAAS